MVSTSGSFGGQMVILIVACLLSGILYRLGGKKGFNTKFRDLGCPLVLLGAVIALFGLKMGFWWAYLLCFGLSFGFLTTYWDFLFKYDNFWFHGFALGLAGFPLLWCGVPWWILTIRLVICTVGMGLWSKFIGWDELEEGGRGVFFIL
jgi:hypothetical protein